MITNPFSDEIHYGLSVMLWEAYFKYLDKDEIQSLESQKISNIDLSKILIKEDRLERFSKPEWEKAIKEFNSLSLEEKITYLTNFIFKNKEYTV